MTVLTARRGVEAGSSGPGCRLVRVLDADPDLAAFVPAGERPLARSASSAPLFTHARGPWRLVPRPDAASLGALILEGLVIVRVEVDNRAHLELLGEGDLVSPWIGMEPDPGLPTVVTSHVVGDLRLALLDRGFSVRMARWPEVYAALNQRLLARLRRLSLQSAIHALPRIEERVELTLWELAYRFGQVTPRGHRLRLRFTHSQLAEMVAAQRPSVTTALARLEANRRLVRESKDEWLLRGAPPSRLAGLGSMSGPGS